MFKYREERYVKGLRASRDWSCAHKGGVGTTQSQVTMVIAPLWPDKPILVTFDSTGRYNQTAMSESGLSHESNGKRKT